MNDFVKTAAGRLLVFALGLALAGGGIAVWMGEPAATWLLAWIFPVTAALCIVSLARASIDSWGYAVAGAVALPFVALLYVPALGLAIQTASWVSWPLVLIGTGAIALGIRPRARFASRSNSRRQARPRSRSTTPADVACAPSLARRCRPEPIASRGTVATRRVVRAAPECSSREPARRERSRADASSASTSRGLHCRP